nr:ribonuclease III domain-containing protein [Candidatus Sigynarchaeota archaeon]
MIEDNIGYTFSNKGLLERALTRKAYALEQKQEGIECEDQEIFRTLGDAVLKTILADILIQNGAKTRNEITNKKSKLETESHLSRVAQKLGIAPDIKLGKGEQKQGAIEVPLVLAEALEAIIGAIYYDGGFNAAKEVIKKWFDLKVF